MKRFLVIATSGLTFLLFFVVATIADPESCRDTLNQYKSAKSDVGGALIDYTNCIRSTDGHDDCSSEFSILKSAQDDFEVAVSEYESECQ